MSKPSLRASIVTARTYLRPLDESDTVFETEEQAADRIIDHQRWLWQRAKAGFRRWSSKYGEWKLADLTDEEEAELAELRALFLDRKVTFSGRTRWLGGTDIAKQVESTQFNPLPASQTFITDRGVRSFEDFNDGDEVTVLTHLGNWKRAVVKDAGRRQMLGLTLRRGRTVIWQDTSADHTWILDDGTRVEARELSVGDRLTHSPQGDFFDYDFNALPADEQMWWCYGFVFGDGTLNNGGTSSMVRLCGNKAKYLPRFTSNGFGHSYPPSCDKDPFVYTGGYVKTLPSSDAPARLICAFLRGYLAADGNKAWRQGREVIKGMVTSDPAAADFLRTWLPVFGVYILQDGPVDRETTFGRFQGHAFSFTTGGGHHWKVESVSAIDDEDCWCLTVDDDHSFVLPNGVATGNCCFLEIRAIHDVVDAMWLLLQGCGVGFKPVVGSLNGFANKDMEIEVIRSTRGQYDKGPENNVETFVDDVWTIKIGDSAEAWAKSAGKIMAGKFNAKKLVLDFSNIRGAGGRLRSYGWISSGDEQIAKAYEAIAKIMRNRAGQLLTRIDILDILDWLGTTLSSRRSAEIAVLGYGEPEWQEFALAKKDHFALNPQRAMSNNSVIFWQKPTKYQLRHIFKLIAEGGGSEPGFINGVSALARAPWFKGVNPCAEILLADRGFCNLVETVLFRFNGDEEGLLRAHRLITRANYRQTCVHLDDGILQRGWHENNEFLRLCGAGVTGVVAWEHAGEALAWQTLRETAQEAAHGMADALGLPRAKAVTTIKPSGTQSKALSIEGQEVPEGLHRPLGKYIFNNVRFSVHDPIVGRLAAANYHTFPDPYDPTGVLVRIPVKYDHIEFSTVNGIEVNLETAVEQLERYKLVMDNYVDHNASITVSYSIEEVPEIIDWLVANWDSYVGVSFLYRNDPTKTAADLGYPYLPQVVVGVTEFNAYVSTLRSVNLTDIASSDLMEGTETCVGGACPIR